MDINGLIILGMAQFHERVQHQKSMLLCALNLNQIHSVAHYHNDVSLSSNYMLLRLIHVLNALF